MIALIVLAVVGWCCAIYFAWIAWDASMQLGDAVAQHDGMALDLATARDACEESRSALIHLMLHHNKRRGEPTDVDA